MAFALQPVSLILYLS